MSRKRTKGLLPGVLEVLQSLKSSSLPFHGVFFSFGLHWCSSEDPGPLIHSEMQRASCVRETHVHHATCACRNKCAKEHAVDAWQQVCFIVGRGSCVLASVPVIDHRPIVLLPSRYER